MPGVALHPIESGQGLGVQKAISGTMIDELYERSPRDQLEEYGKTPEGRTQEVDAIPTALLEYTCGVAERARKPVDAMVSAFTVE